MDKTIYDLIIFANKFLDADAQKFEQFKEQMFLSVHDQVTAQLAISQETQEMLKELLDRLGNATAAPMPVE
jgi:hypothetical protein